MRIFNFVRTGLTRARFKGRMQRIGSLLLSAAFLFPCMPGTPALLAVNASSDVGPSHDYVLCAYAYDAKAPTFADRDAQYLTHIIWSFALIDDGKVTGAHWRNIKTLQAYKQKHPHIKTLMAIGGWGADGFSQAAKTPEGRALFVSSAIELAKRYDFDGIDIDWEYPGNPVAGIAASVSDRKNFTYLLEDLRAALNEWSAEDGKYRMLTIAVGASADCAKGINCQAIEPYVDFVNVMSYDLSGGSAVTAHHTNLFPAGESARGVSAHAAIEAFNEAGIPLRKLVVGAAFYGHLWKNVTSTDNNGLKQPAGDRGGTAVSYAAIMSKYYGKNGYQVYWDDAASAPYLFNGTNFISYDNPESVRLKAVYARERGLGGVMFWEYSHDPSGELIKAIGAGLSKK